MTAGDIKDLLCMSKQTSMLQADMDLLHREQRLDNASRVWDLREPGQGSRPLHLVLSARNPRHALGTGQLAATHPTPDAKEVNLRPIITVLLENTVLHEQGLVVELCGPMDAQVACIQQDSKAWSMDCHGTLFLVFVSEPRKTGFGV